MLVKKSEFVISNTDIKKCPAPNMPEYAFIGRSNVGKSSLINSITKRKSLAKISGKPGKTQLINHFIINDSWYLVDLPGYGYASVSKKQRIDTLRMMTLLNLTIFRFNILELNESKLTLVLLTKLVIKDKLLDPFLGNWNPILFSWTKFCFLYRFHSSFLKAKSGRTH